MKGMTPEQKAEVLTVAVVLYQDLPFWKRRAVRKWFLSNNWDVSHEWEKCLDVARRMVENRDWQVRDKTTT